MLPDGRSVWVYVAVSNQRCPLLTHIDYMPPSHHLWPGCVTVSVLARNAGSSPGRSAFWLQPWASCPHTRASVTKQYNLVPVNGQWCPATGEVTVGLALHWPCITDFSGLSTYGLMAEHPTYALLWSMAHLPFYLLLVTVCKYGDFHKTGSTNELQSCQKLVKTCLWRDTQTYSAWYYAGESSDRMIHKVNYPKEDLNAVSCKVLIPNDVEKSAIETNQVPETCQMLLHG